jgi:hypothetical protein
MKEARNLYNQSPRASISNSSQCTSWSSPKERQDKSESKVQEILNVDELAPIINLTDRPNPERTNDNINAPRNTIAHSQQQYLCQGVDGGGKVPESCFARTNLGDDVDRWSVHAFSSPLYVLVYAVCTVRMTKGKAGLKSSTTFFFVTQLLKAQRHSRVQKQMSGPVHTLLCNSSGGDSSTN